jgi:hypothetical protein
VVEINTKNKNPKQTVAFKMPLDEQKASGINLEPWSAVRWW